MSTPESITEFHCRHIRESIKQGDHSLIECLNYLKNHASDHRTRLQWQWTGQQLVMNGWLTVNDSNNFEVKHD